MSQGLLCETLIEPSLHTRFHREVLNLARSPEWLTTCTLAVTTQSKIGNFQALFCTDADRVDGFDGQTHESLNLILHPKEAIVTQTGDNGAESAVCFDSDDKGSGTPWNLAPEITSFIIKAIGKCKKDATIPVALKFILSTVDGYLARSDFLEQRLDGVKHVISVVDDFCVHGKK
ncbi:hypothetical protein BO71DRAFT_424863 [Aspergillus ellipticus CBS 707.79]|uniref:Uncharacterized protein n=1 Tax=Aspergillus ellipticus CBS 707.79 TaxID=1448320 RepID=A0A319DQB6_9EURO|nr:hypothetical protein BO71DRAFT_424863 [Aspergillus ellipticus CBS 707.79]